MHVTPGRNEKGQAMDLVLIEILLWGGLIFFFWALKDGLGSVETDIESLGMIKNAKLTGVSAQLGRFVSADELEERIGSYMGKDIYRYAIIGGKRYRFDRVHPPSMLIALEADERFIDPGLVYQECGEQSEAARA
jgi:hypothetical protein